MGVLAKWTGAIDAVRERSRHEEHRAQALWRTGRPKKSRPAWLPAGLVARKRVRNGQHRRRHAERRERRGALRSTLETRIQRRDFGKGLEARERQRHRVEVVRAATRRDRYHVLEQRRTARH